MQVTHKMLRPFFAAVLLSFCSFVVKAQSTDTTVTFQEFIAQFPVAQLPYQIGEEALRSEVQQGGTPMARRLAVEYFDFLPVLDEMARRDNMAVSAQPVAAFSTPTHIAVLYNTGRKYARQYKTYHLTVFDRQGNLVASRCLGGVNATNMTAFDLDAQLQVTARAYRLDWMKNIHTNGPIGNTLVDAYALPVQQFSAVAAKQAGQDWEYRPVTPALVNGLTASAEK